MYKHKYVKYKKKYLDLIGGTGPVQQILDDEKIRDRQYQNNKQLFDVTFTKATITGTNAFYGCENLTTISVPLATTIEIGAFKNCKQLQTINLPLVNTIGAGTFSNCITLKTLSLPTVTHVVDRTFAGCIGLETITLPNVTNIDLYAFLVFFCHFSY